MNGCVLDSYKIRAAENSVAANHALLLHFRTSGKLERPNLLGYGEKVLENFRSRMILSGACKEEDTRKMSVRKEGVSQSRWEVGWELWKASHNMVVVTCHDSGLAK